MDVERCIICGEPIPEGIQVCFACEKKTIKELSIKNDYKRKK